MCDDDNAEVRAKLQNAEPVDRQARPVAVTEHQR
jgi:hypothetical protein